MILGDNKALGIDGFNAKFFKARWTVIKAYVLAAVHEFYDNNRLYANVNCTLVTLIPKRPGEKQ